jgi:hypothetical protein
MTKCLDGVRKLACGRRARKWDRTAGLPLSRSVVVAVVLTGMQTLRRARFFVYRNMPLSFGTFLQIAPQNLSIDKGSVEQPNRLGEIKFSAKSVRNLLRAPLKA